MSEQDDAVMTPQDAEQASQDWERYREDPGFQALVQGAVQERMSTDIGDIVKGELNSAFTANRSNGVQRMPLHETAARAGTGNPDAPGVGANGTFDRMADMWKAMHPYTIQQAGMDSRLAELVAEKALGVGQGDQGGFLVPEDFRATLLSLSIEQSLVRSRAFVMPMPSGSVTIPTIRDSSHASSVYGGFIGYWTPEAGTITQTEPTFGQARLVANKLALSTRVNNELLNDSAIGLEALINRLGPEAISFFEDDAFINGTGAGQPTGILNADCLVTQAAEGGQAAATVVKENLDKMYSRMLPQSLSRAIWLAHSDTIPELLSLSQTVGTGGAPVMVANIAQAPNFSIYGRPVVFSEKCQTLGTVGDLYFADFAYYVIGDTLSLQAAMSTHSRFLQDQTEFKFTLRLDGRPWLDSALTPKNGSTTVSPFVALATRA